MNKDKNIEFYVSPEQGNNKWTGKLPAPNKGRKNGPFSTIQAAKTAIRKLKKNKNFNQTVTVFLRGGTYFLKKSLDFSPLDSGIGWKNSRARIPDISPIPITYTAYGNEKPIVSGGRRITGFKEESLNGKTVWVTSIPAVKRGTWNFRQLWVNGERRFRPRLPREGFYYVKKLADTFKIKGKGWNRYADDRFIYTKGDMAKWRNLNDVEVVVCNFWIDSHMWLKSIDAKKHLAILDRKCITNLADE